MHTGGARTVSVMTAVLALAGLTTFAALHPFGVPVAVLICCAMLSAMAVHRHAWLVVVPGLLPVVDLAPWTGAIHVNESDALILCAVLWLSLRRMFHLSRAHRVSTRFRLDAVSWFVVLLMLGSYLVSTDWSRLSDVFSDPSLLAGYATPLNGPRLAKGFLWALLLLPFLARAFNRDPRGARRALAGGLLLSLTLVALGAVYERAAFVDLSNFSSDYRTTAFFWEVNVGGATLDGWLALTVPFAVWLALRARAPVRALACVALLCLAGYVVFTTFSRGLYLGIVLGCGLLVISMARGEIGAARWQEVSLRMLLLALGGSVLCILLVAVFSTGGYRGLLATMGVIGLVYLVGPVATMLPRPGWTAAALTAIAATVVSVAAMYWIPKGVYLAYGVGFIAVLVLLYGRLNTGSFDPAVLAVGAVIWTAANAALVTLFWSEGRGLTAGVLGSVVVLSPLLPVSAKPALCWRPSVAMTVRMVFGLGILLAIVLVTGTYYASERVGTAAKDLQDREAHWALGASLPVGGLERWLGIGTGQYAERYFWSARQGTLPGNHRIVIDEGTRYLRLGGPTHVLGFGELYRVSQRVRPGLVAPFTISMRARSVAGGHVHVELCRKHLLYDGGCSVAELSVPAGAEWTELTLMLPAGGLGDAGLLPRMTMFSLANADSHVLDVDDVSLIDAQGRSLLRNGDFAAGSDFWFFSSDRHHLPWHAKNLWLHYFIEQGILGLAAFSVMFALALYRVTLGRARRDELALPLAAGLIAFGVVGLFDSLVDAPRMSVLLFLLLFLALGLRHRSATGDPGAKPSGGLAGS